jgi:hypothetical protein
VLSLLARLADHTSDAMVAGISALIFCIATPLAVFALRGRIKISAPFVVALWSLVVPAAVGFLLSSLFVIAGP